MMDEQTELSGWTEGRAGVLGRGPEHVSPWGGRSTRGRAGQGEDACSGGSFLEPSSSRTSGARRKPGSLKAVKKRIAHT